MRSTLLSQACAGVTAGLAARLGSRCAVCTDWQTQALCATCQAQFAGDRPRCRRCALAVPEPADPAPAHRAPLALCGACLREPGALERTIAAVDYGFPWDGLILRLKHSPAAEGAAALAGLLRSAIGRQGSMPPPIDLVLPVPLSADRLRERGHNQAWELARRVARGLGLPARADLLQRRPGEHQQALDRAARQRNVRGLFHLAPGAAAVLTAAPRIALVDDVMTTGATLQELARTLQAAGVRQVQAWVVARTPA